MKATNGPGGGGKDEEILGVNFGFEDHGISLDVEIGENVKKVFDATKSARKILENFKAKAVARSNKPKTVKVRKGTAVAIKPNQQITVVRPQGYNVYPQIQMANNTTPISVVRQWPYRPGSNQQYIIRTEGSGTVRTTNTISYVRPNVSQGQTVPMNHQPLIFDANSGLLLYQGQIQNFGGQQQQAIRPATASQAVRANVYRQPLNPTVTNFNTASSQQQPRIYTAKPNTNQPTVYTSASTFQTPRIVGTTSIRPMTPIASLMPPPASPQTASTVQRQYLQQQQNQQWQRQIASQSPNLRQQLSSVGGNGQQQRPVMQQQQRLPLQQQQQQRLSTPRTPILPQPRLTAPQPRLAVSPQQRLPGQLQQQRMPGQQSVRLPGQQPQTRMPLTPQTRTIPGQPTATRYSSPTASSVAKPAAETTKPSNTVEMPGNENDSNNNKTFPSLVVTVKPCLMEKQLRSSLGAARAELDAKVKSLLVYSPQKFTEWLMQRGLLRIEHKCTVHVGDDNLPYPYKLGMYSDNRQPHSGGYVWIADCCGKEKEVSVFQGSIFEASIYTPGTLLKLIYHWSCQTTANNVLQWVKVTSYYLKNFYTLLRSACVAALHEMCPVMGGTDKYVEIGIITLGTTLASSTGPRNVKVEILGVFDPSNKIIRMKVINPQNDGVTQATHSRIMQILWPLNHWVNKSSTILIDNSIDKSLLAEMGFKKVQQSKAPLPNPGQSKPIIPTNINVMNYLKHVIPKMFQSTLCVLSKSLIQQFLDELSWREVWGGNPSKTFDNMLNHLVEMTKWDTGESLISRLNKISLDPFGEWSYSRNLPQGIDMLPSSITGGGDMPLLSIQSPLASKGMNGVTKPVPSTSVKNKSPAANKPPVLSPQATPMTSNQQATSGLKRKFTMDLTPFLALEPKNHVLQSHYYGTVKGKLEKAVGTYGGHLKCPLCLKALASSEEIMMHIYRHVMYGAGRSKLKESCNYCLKDFQSKSALTTHVQNVHTLSAERYCCRICQLTFVSEGTWIIHMWENHDELEMPYICEICNFRSSMHTDVIEHFYKEHAGADHVVCPLCLKTLTVRTVSCIKQVVVHFQNHNLRRNKKCPQCTLLFPTDNEYRHHIIIDGAHRGRTRQESVRYVLSSQEVASYMPKPPKVPKDKFVLPPQAKKPKLNHTAPPPKGANSLNTFATPIDTDGTFTVEPFDVEVFCDDNTICLECKSDLESESHFTGYMTCNKCTFATCCSRAMTSHHNRSHTEAKPNNLMAGLRLAPVKHLDNLLKCICGFSSANPYHIAEHLVQCDQGTAYPNKAAAQLNSSSEDAASPPVLSPAAEIPESIPA